MGCLGSNTVNDVKKALKGEKYRVVFMVGADTSPLAPLASKAAEEFRHTLINVNDLGQGKITNPLLKAVVQDFTNELKGSGVVSSSTISSPASSCLFTEKERTYATGSMWKTIARPLTWWCARAARVRSTT